MHSRKSRLTPPSSSRSCAIGRVQDRRQSSVRPSPITVPPSASKAPPFLSPPRRPSKTPPPSAALLPDDDDEGSCASASSNATRLSHLSSSAQISTLRRSFVQVCIRVRPLLVGNRAVQQRSITSFGSVVWAHDITTLRHVDPIQNIIGNRRSTYTFDSIHGVSSKTTDIYEKEVRPVVHAAMAGYHGSILCYGQTGTGKTYTMQGNVFDELGASPSAPGIMPLSVDECFRYVGGDAADHREYLFRVSYLEIYNEAIRDLLNPGGGSCGVSSGRKIPGRSSSSTSIRLMENRRGETILHGAREVVVTSPAQAYALIASGEAHRATGATGMNARSSRSHTIFRIIIESKCRVFGRASSGNSVGSSGGGSCGDLEAPVRISTLSLVDLAGSECSKGANTKGIRQKEGHYINQSLGTLGRVIHRLSEIQVDGKGNGNVVHIPYRDSKLTRILQSSLGGNAQVSLICTVSIAENALDETHNTLKFASRAKKIKQRAVVTEVTDERAMLQRYREEIESLKKELQQMRFEKHTSAVAAAAATEVKDGVKKQGIISKFLGKLSNDSCSDGSNDIDDEGELKEAIQNLENVIIKSRVAGGKASPDDITSLEMASPMSSAEENTASFFTPMATKAISATPFSAASPDTSLLEELGRVKTHLANVLQKRTASRSTWSPTVINSNMVAISEIGGRVLKLDREGPMSSKRDEEVRGLRERLKEQEVRSNVRDADREFLEKQLKEKERLIKEVAELLDAAESRQRHLESENSRLRFKNLQLENEITRLSLAPSLGGGCGQKYYNQVGKNIVNHSDDIDLPEVDLLADL